MTGLRIENLSVEIDGKPILSQVSVSVSPGEIHALVGESGSGKSMTALAAMALLPEGARATGRILLGDDDVLTLAEPALCRLRGGRAGMVFQEPMTALNPLQTIGHQVAEAVSIHHRVTRAEARRRAAETLERVGLPPADFPLTRYPHELSGGQRQRVVIAIALAAGPKLLIADEPTTALDVTTQAGILGLFRSLVAEAGIGVLLITHDLAVVGEIADTISVMQAGRIVEQGAAGEILSAPTHDHARLLLQASAYHPPARGRVVAAEPVLTVEAISRHYQAGGGLFARPTAPIRAVDDVSLTLDRGEIVGLVGESGSGKSTLSRILLGLDRADQGRVSLLGEDFPARNPSSRKAQRRQLQAVFQDPYGSFNPRWPVARIVAEPLDLLDPRPDPAGRRQKVAAALTRVGLEAEMVTRYPHQFSGGQRQRIALARALILDPAVIVLDEATSALDVSVRAEILALIAGLATGSRTAFLFIAHDLEIVRGLCDRVVVMQAGRIVEQGPAAALFANPEHAYTRSLLAASPKLPALSRTS